MPIIVGSSPGAPAWEFDPVSEDAANANLPLTGNYAVRADVPGFQAPMPQPDVLYASSVDTEGENPASTRFRNRQIGMTVDVDGSGALLDLEFKIAKLIREGGTLLYQTKTGDEIVFDVLSVSSFDFPTDDQWILGGIATVSFTLECKPLGRGPEVDMGDNVETTLPWLVFTEAAVKGTWPGLGRLVIDNDDATNDQWWVAWGLESRYYSSAASAALGWQAESLTAMGGSATAAGPSGASGGGSNVMRNTALTTGYQPILSTQATGGGAHMSHVGSFRVFTRVQAPTTNTGDLTVAFQWSEGDFTRVSTNTAYVLPTALEGSWQIVDLGLVSLPKATTGTQRWEGRILAKSTVAGDDLDVDWLVLMPVDEGYGTASADARLIEPSALSVMDGFAQTAGNLAGKTPEVGAAWSGAGDANDFQVSGTGLVSRSDLTDSGAGGGYATGRYDVAGSAMTAQVVQADIRMSDATAVAGSGPLVGLVARYVDASNFALLYWNTGTGDVWFSRRVAAVDTDLVRVFNGNLGWLKLTSNDWVTFRLAVLADGRFFAWLGNQGTNLGDPVLSGTNTALATAGALASGKAGIYTWQAFGTTNTVSFDNFEAYPAAFDAAVYASQSLEVRSDRVVREDSAGAVWARPAAYKGDYLLVPPAGAEGRTTRVVVLGKRAVPNSIVPDAGTDDISARLFVTPRYLTVPEP